MLVQVNPKENIIEIEIDSTDIIAAQAPFKDSQWKFTWLIKDPVSKVEFVLTIPVEYIEKMLKKNNEKFAPNDRVKYIGSNIEGTIIAMSNHVDSITTAQVIFEEISQEPEEVAQDLLERV